MLQGTLKTKCIFIFALTSFNMGIYAGVLLFQVVDARAGPGTKSLTKFKSKKLKKNLENPDKPVKEKIKKKHR